MGMIVQNNNASMLALGQLKKNETTLSKQLHKVASGMKINSAGDGASEYSISEKMRIRIRALGQDHDNVSKGADMLYLAEGGIQNQINILRTIKEKVIDASNDTNTEIDRATIQKEINQGWSQIQEIATDTSYNGRNVLLEGNMVVDTVKSWNVLDQVTQAPDSEMSGLLTYKQHEASLIDTLDGQTGPFDTFNDWKETVPAAATSTMTTMGISSTTALTGYTAGTPNTVTIDLSQAYTDANVPNNLDNTGFSIPSNWRYVLTTDPSRNYQNVDKTIDISNCTSLAEVAQKIAGISYSYSGVTATASGTTVTFTTTSTGASTNNTTAEGITRQAKTEQVGAHPVIPARPATPASPAASATHVLGGITLSGGVDESGIPDIIDMPYTAGKAATGSWNISGVPAGSGIQLKTGGYTYYLQFTDGTNGFAHDPNTNIFTIGKDAVSTRSFGDSSYGVTVTVNHGTLSIQSRNAKYGATSASRFSVVDAFAEGAAKPAQPATPEQPADPGRTVTYTAVAALGANTIQNLRTGTDGTPAHTVIDLSAYDTTDAKALEDFIAGLAGKGLTVTNPSSTSSSTGVEFIDSQDENDGLPGENALYKLNNNSSVNYALHLSPAINTYQQVDLASLRSAVASGTTIAKAFADLMNGKVHSSIVYDTTDPTKVVGLKVTGPQNANLEVAEGELRHYDLDFASWLKDHPDLKLPGDLEGKGFRTYCATDSSQWFNFEFINGTKDMDGKPLSGKDGSSVVKEDIKTIVIDVEQVTDAKSLVKAIYDQAEPVLTGGDKRFNHLMRLSGDPENGILRVYDERRFPVDTYPDYQTKGAKIGTGIMDNVVLSRRKVYSDDLVIQDTDHASQNIHIKIPRTTLDHVLGYTPGTREPEDYHVLTKEKREMLLGIPPKEGALDHGLNYLIDANTLIGAQINRMYYSGQNIQTASENTTASESVIRDADMAKEMTGYVRSSILAQTAQSMLAQANQNAGAVLSLLGGQ